MCQGSFKGVSRKFPRSFKKLLRAFKENLKGISRKFLRVFQRKLKGVPRKFKDF